MSKETQDFNEVAQSHDTNFKDILHEGEEFVGHIKKNYTDLEALKKDITANTKDLSVHQNKLGPLKRDAEHLEIDQNHHTQTHDLTTEYK